MSIPCFNLLIEKLFVCHGLEVNAELKHQIEGMFLESYETPFP